MENCCRKTYFNMRNAITDQMAKVVTELKTEDGGQVSGGLVERMQRQLWDIMEDPEANIVAKSGKIKQLNPSSTISVSSVRHLRDLRGYLDLLHVPWHHPSAAGQTQISSVELSTNLRKVSQ